MPEPASTPITGPFTPTPSPGRRAAAGSFRVDVDPRYAGPGAPLCGHLGALMLDGAFTLLEVPPVRVRRGCVEFDGVVPDRSCDVRVWKTAEDRRGCQLVATMDDGSRLVASAFVEVSASHTDPCALGAAAPHFADPPGLPMPSPGSALGVESEFLVRDAHAEEPDRFGGYIRRKQPVRLDAGALLPMADAWGGGSAAPGATRFLELKLCRPLPDPNLDHRRHVKVQLRDSGRLGSTVFQTGGLWTFSGVPLANLRRHVRR